MGQTYSTWLRAITPIPAQCDQRNQYSGFPHPIPGQPCQRHCIQGRPVYGKWACECPKGTKVNPNWPVAGKHRDEWYRDRITGKMVHNPDRLCIPEDQDVTLTPVGGAAPVIPDSNQLVQPVQENPVPVQAVVVQGPGQAPQLIKPLNKRID